MSKIQVQTTINGEEASFLCDGQQSLLSALRDELGLTGTKEGCSTGDCGACSITLDGQLVPACLVLAAEAEGARSVRSRASRPRAASIRSSRSSSSTPRCSAASARRA